MRRACFSVRGLCVWRLSDVDKVEEVMEDINEQIALGEEIGEAMATPIGPVMDEVSSEQKPRSRGPYDPSIRTTLPRNSTKWSLR